MEDLAVLAALNHSGSFEKNFFKLKKKKKKVLFTGQGSVRMVKNCNLDLENAARGHRPRLAFSRPRLQLLTIRTSQPANNIYFHQLQWPVL